MILTKTVLDESTIERLCDEWADVHGKLGFTILSMQWRRDKTQYQVPLIADDMTVDKIVFPKTNLVTQLEKIPGECSLLISKRPGTKFTQVVLVNNAYEASRKQARMEHLSEKQKNKRLALIDELQENPDHRSMEELKQAYREMNRQIKKLRLRIQLNNNQGALEDDDLSEREQNSPVA